MEQFGQRDNWSLRNWKSSQSACVCSYVQLIFLQLGLKQDIEKKSGLETLWKQVRASIRESQSESIGRNQVKRCDRWWWTWWTSEVHITLIGSRKEPVRFGSFVETLVSQALLSFDCISFAAGALDLTAQALISHYYYYIIHVWRITYTPPQPQPHSSQVEGWLGRRFCNHMLTYWENSYYCSSRL